MSVKVGQELPEITLHRGADVAVWLIEPASVGAKVASAMRSAANQSDLVPIPRRLLDLADELLKHDSPLARLHAQMERGA